MARTTLVFAGALALIVSCAADPRDPDVESGFESAWSGGDDGSTSGDADPSADTGEDDDAGDSDAEGGEDSDAETGGDADTGSGGQGGQTGEYDYPATDARIYAPPTVHDGPGPVAVIFGFHGAGDSKSNFMNVLLGGGSWRSIADDDGIIIVTMQGAAGQSVWNYPIDVPGWPLSVGTGDVDRVEDTLDHLRESYDVDDGRIYAIGFSMGATMATEVGLYLDDTFAAFMATAQGTPVQGYQSLAPMSRYQLPALFQGDPGDPVYASVPYTADLLESNGHTVELREFPGTGHVGSWMSSTVMDPGPAQVWGWLSQFEHP